MAFTLEVPDPALENSSPEFIPYPAEYFLCINDLSEISFAATDTDGDSLVYLLIDPLKGAGTSIFQPIVPSGALPRPYPSLTWNSGYGPSDAVGGDTPLALNVETGMALAQPNTQGFYTLAVMVEEYRNGEKIGFVIREVQLPALVCTLPPPLEIATATGDTIFDVLANMQFGLDLEITNPNMTDTLVVSATADFLVGNGDPILIPPSDELLINLSEAFYFSPLCEHISADPHMVSIHASSGNFIATKNIFINVQNEIDEPTFLAHPLADGSLGISIDLYDPSTWCFDFVFQDPNMADSLSVIPSADIFSNSNVSAALPSMSQGSATLPFCWDVLCSEVVEEPYLIDFEVLTTNCGVEETLNVTVPVHVVVAEDEPTAFANMGSVYNFVFNSAESWCIPVEVTDSNLFDSLYVTAGSELFSLSENPATFESLEGFGNVEGELCWTPTLEDIREEPYVINFTAYANSCQTDEFVSKTVEFYILPQDSILSSSSANPMHFELYPNPTINTVKMSHRGGRGGQYAIYDLSGRLQLIGNCIGNATEIDLGHLPKGLYMLRYTSSGREASAKLMVQ